MAGTAECRCAGLPRRDRARPPSMSVPRLWESPLPRKRHTSWPSHDQIVAACAVGGRRAIDAYTQAQGITAASQIHASRLPLQLGDALREAIALGPQPCDLD